MNRSNLSGLGILSAMLILILDGKTALSAALQGLRLCCATVIPSLLPFLFLSALLTSSLSAGSWLRPLGRLFRIPVGCEGILLSAFLGGYPAGAHSIRSAWAAGALSEENAERMLSYCNNPGPALIFGMASSLFSDRRMLWAIWGIQILSALAVSTLASPTPQEHIQAPAKALSAPEAMGTALGILGQICGWVILFRILTGFLDRWFLWLLPVPGQVIVTGLLELTNGIWALGQLESIGARFVLCSAMLSFGGICVCMQTASAARGLSLRACFRGQLLKSLLSILLSAAWVQGLWWIGPGFAGIFLIISAKSKNNCRNMRQLHV